MHTNKDEHERVISSYCGEGQVTVIITLKVNTKEVDNIATEMAKYPCIEELFLVTGDIDIVAKARFANYKEFKDFMVKNVSAIPGVRETSSLVVVATYKEGGMLKDFES